MIVGLPLQELRHTRAVQEILEEGRQEEAAALAIRQLVRRFGNLDQATRETLAALPLQTLEQLAEWTEQICSTSPALAICRPG
ncbi:MAG: DUF4351 domain-containing protein [Cyanobium sp.]